jgi:hypothetical protein
MSGASSRRTTKLKQSILLRCLWVDHSSHHPKVEGSSPTTAAGRWRENGKKIQKNLKCNSKD